MTEPIKRIRIAIKDIKSNPFQSQIQSGKLDQDSLDTIKKTANEGKTFRQSFYVRKVANDYELVAGHHRLAVARELFGPNFEIDPVVVNYTDAEMLSQMVGDNFQSNNPQRNIDSIRAAHEYLKTHGHENGICKLGFPAAGKASHAGMWGGLRNGCKVGDHGGIDCVTAFLGVWKKSTVGSFFQLAGLKDSPGLHPKIIAALAPPTGSREGGHGTRIGEITQQIALAFTRLSLEDQEAVFDVIVQADPPLANVLAEKIIAIAQSQGVKAALIEAKSLLSKQKSAKDAAKAQAAAAKKRKKQEEKQAREKVKAEKKAQREQQRAAKLAEKAQKKADKEADRARKAKEQSDRIARSAATKEEKKRARQQEREAQKRAKNADRARKKADKEARKQEKQRQRARKKAEKEAEKEKLKQERASRVFQKLTLPEAQLKFFKLLPFEAAEVAWKTAAKYLHPDRGGDGQLMAELNGLWGVIKEKQYGK